MSTFNPQLNNPISQETDDPQRIQLSRSLLQMELEESYRKATRFNILAGIMILGTGLLYYATFNTTCQVKFLEVVNSIDTTPVNEFIMNVVEPYLVNLMAH